MVTVHRGVAFALDPVAGYACVGSCMACLERWVVRRCVLPIVCGCATVFCARLHECVRWAGGGGKGV